MKVSKRHHGLLMFVATLLLLTSCQKEGTEVWQSTTKGAYTVTMTVDRDKREAVCSADYQKPFEGILQDGYVYSYQVINDSVLSLCSVSSATNEVKAELEYVYKEVAKDCVALSYRGILPAYAFLVSDITFTKISSEQ